jgi:hypothetical protein
VARCISSTQAPPRFKSRFKLHQGDGNWSALRTVTIPANGAAHELLNDLSTSWIRLSPLTAATNLTASCILSNPYPHRTPPSVVSEEFAALADIRDTANLT